MAELATFTADFRSLRVMFRHDCGGYDAGSALACFGEADLAMIEVGAAQGEDAERGAYDWWPLSVGGHTIGELRDDASGMTIHVTPETWMAGVGLLLPARDEEG
jgi:hypothetical protein